jgi:hypothetical protein
VWPKCEHREHVLSDNQLESCSSNVSAYERRQPREGDHFRLAQKDTTLAPLRSRKPPGPSLCRPLSLPKPSPRSMDRRGTAAYSALHTHKVPDEHGSSRLQHRAMSTCGQPVPHAGAPSATRLPVRGQERRIRTHTRLDRYRARRSSKGSDCFRDVAAERHRPRSGSVAVFTGAGLNHRQVTRSDVYDLGTKLCRLDRAADGGFARRATKMVACLPSRWATVASATCAPPSAGLA